MVARARRSSSESAPFNDLTERDADKGFGFMVGDDQVVHRALQLLESRLRAADVTLTSPTAVRDYLRLRLADLEHEVFVVLFLDSQHRLLAAEEMGGFNPSTQQLHEIVVPASRSAASFSAVR